MAKVHITVKRGAQIIEVTEGRKLPAIRSVGQAAIVTRGELHTDPENGDACYEFTFIGRNWTVDVKDVEVH